MTPERVRVEPLGDRFAIIVRHDSRETVLADYERDVANEFAGYLRQAIAEAVAEEREMQERAAADNGT